MMATRRLPNRNLLLAALPAADYARIEPALPIVPLKLKDVLHKPGEMIRHVFFPGDGFCSVLTVLEDGDMVEVATIGREGHGRHVRRSGRRTDTVPGDGTGRNGRVLPHDDRCVSHRDGSPGTVPRTDDAVRAGARRVRDAVNGLQRRPLSRAAARALATDGARPRREERVSAHAGIRGDD